MNALIGDASSDFDVGRANDALRLLAEACQEDRLSIKELQKLRRVVLDRLEQNTPPFFRTPNQDDTIVWSTALLQPESPAPLRNERVVEKKLSSAFLLFMASFLLSTGFIYAFSLVITKALGGGQ